MLRMSFLNSFKRKKLWQALLRIKIVIISFSKKICTQNYLINPLKLSRKSELNFKITKVLWNKKLDVMEVLNKRS